MNPPYAGTGSGVQKAKEEGTTISNTSKEMLSNGWGKSS